jgi:hypothetical protein
MFSRILLAAAALAAAPSAFAQQAQDDTTAKAPLPLLYSSAGLAWSRETGLELEAGFQWEVSKDVLLRFSPANIALFDGDVPAGFIRDNEGLQRDCRVAATGEVAFEEDCTPELDTEWRSVVEAQFRVAKGFRLGAGVSYLLQGDFRPEDGRVAPFASLAWDIGEGMGFEVRAGSEYVALQLRGLW